MRLDVTAAAEASRVARWRLRVSGQVQGVGFRPLVYRLAREMGFAGWVRNGVQGVEIELQGPGGVEAFVRRLRDEAPALARIDALDAEECAPAADGDAFVIRPSQTGPVATASAPDAAVCPECLAELFDPGNRRHRYAFTHCTACGPRYSVTSALPFDRGRTSMAAFPLCAACRHEYDDANDRRFHAELNACPACGPQLRLVDAQARVRDGGDAIEAALARLSRGEIVALKDAGGFHLLCDARNANAVARLRARKGRDEKPFAVMFPTCEALAGYAWAGPEERRLLEGRERPIVLLRKMPECDGRLPGVAAGFAWLGAMLPYAPVHWLLFHEAAGRPPGTHWLSRPPALVLVMTSANPAGEPLVTDNAEALDRLAGFADVFLVHDREILARCDDSVMLLGSGGPAFVRRARGFSPQPIALAQAGPSVLACGAELKNTVCLTRGAQAFLSPHIGDLDDRASCRAWGESVRHLTRLLGVTPEGVAHDSHPEFFGSAFAADYARELGIPRIAVQHHHAHLAAVLAEHDGEGAALGLALDGMGLGTDGGIWGGELLYLAGSAMTRIGHLRELPLPGGDRAAQAPWRMACGALHLLGRADEIGRRYGAPGQAIAAMLARGLNSPPTSSAGRWFDAAAGLLGISERQGFEAHAAMRLESLAAAHGAVLPLAGGYRLTADGNLDFLPLLDALSGITDQRRGAALFHATFSAGLAEWVAPVAAQYGVRRVALGGGCFVNRFLGASLTARLSAHGLTVLHARQAPPNDGGLSLGQAWVAMRMLSRN
ncbi:MAG: carbamoyltransferase HypF [Betaproteobacteria bacterium]|nr:carbamoyltransferase HypF [Betaproteobacteria bacterium]